MVDSPLEIPGSLAGCLETHGQAETRARRDQATKPGDDARRRSGTCPTVFMAALWLAATLTSSGCLFEKKPRAFVVPALKPQPPVAAKPVPMVDDPPELADTLTPEVVPVPLPVAASMDPQLPPAPRPAAPARGPVPRAPAPVKTVPPPEPQQPPAPKITQILSPQESNNLTRTYEESMARVDRALLDLGKKILGAPDRDTLDLIRSFQTQAKQAREQDLVAAVNLAKRADGLAKDLLARLP
jgi:hypothetical protein